MRSPLSLSIALGGLLFGVLALAQDTSEGEFAQIFSGYSGFIREEDVRITDRRIEQPLGADIQKTHETYTSTRVSLFRFQDGHATGSGSTSVEWVESSHVTGKFECDSGASATYSSSGQMVERTQGSGAGPASCEGYLDETGASITCIGLDEYEVTTIRRTVGRTESSCPDVLPAGSSDETTTTSSVEGYSAAGDTVFSNGPPPRVLSGTFTESFDEGHQRTTTWFLAKEGDYELLLEPQADYASWRPKAGRTERERGNALTIKATLRRKDGKPLDVYAKEVRFRLAQRSHEPGVMMNAPASQQREVPALPDLMFEDPLNAPLDLVVQGENGREAVTVPGPFYEVVYAVVSSFDWGAHGTLTAEAVLSTGERVPGVPAGRSGEYELLIPSRASVDDPIAEGWRALGAGRSGDALSDVDGTPTGDGHAGDGLTLYEEYRGFSVNGVRVEGDAEKKELFVLNRVGGGALRGLSLFAKSSALKLHTGLAPDELGDGRVINFNSTGRFRRTLQHALVLETVTEDRHYAIAVGGPGTPAKIEAIEFPLDLFVLKSLSDKTDSIVAHELGHGVNVYHHGDADRGERRFRAVDGIVYESPASDLSLTATGKTAVKLLDENGTPLPASFVDVNKVAYVGDQRAQHSGVESCVMRYAVARFHVRSDPAQRILNASPEQKGMNLCSSGVGTGVNDANRSPAPRYGNASDGRGSCVEQLCVNDAHAHPTE